MITGCSFRKPVDKPGDIEMQKKILLRSNRSMLALNIALRRRGGRPIGRHLELRDPQTIAEMANLK